MHARQQQHCIHGWQHEWPGCKLSMEAFHVIAQQGPDTATLYRDSAQTGSAVSPSSVRQGLRLGITERTRYIPEGLEVLFAGGKFVQDLQRCKHHLISYGHIPRQAFSVFFKTLSGSCSCISREICSADASFLFWRESFGALAEGAAGGGNCFRTWQWHCLSCYEQRAACLVSAIWVKSKLTGAVRGAAFR